MSKEESILFLTMAAAGFILSRIPFAGKFFRVFNTLFHEGGHAIAGWLTRSEVLRVDLLFDTSGTTITRSSNKTAQFIISISGYVFASLAPFAFVVLMSAGLEWGLHFSLVALSVLLLFLAVKNLYGILWIVLMLAGYFAVVLYVPDRAWLMMYAFTGIMLAESVWSAAIIAWYGIARPSDAGDATNLHKLTGLHSAVWGLLFLTQALLFFWFTSAFLFQ